MATLVRSWKVGSSLWSHYKTLKESFAWNHPYIWESILVQYDPAPPLRVSVGVLLIPSYQTFDSKPDLGDAVDILRFADVKLSIQVVDFRIVLITVYSQTVQSTGGASHRTMRGLNSNYVLIKLFLKDLSMNLLCLTRQFFLKIKLL